MSGLFDWSFRSFITPKLIQIAYIFCVAFGAIATVVADIVLLVQLNDERGLPWQSPRGIDSTLFGLVLFSPVFYMVAVVLMRVALECLIVFFTMAEALTRRP